MLPWTNTSLQTKHVHIYSNWFRNNGTPRLVQSLLFTCKPSQSPLISFCLSLFILCSSLCLFSVPLSLSIFQMYLNNRNAKCNTQRTVNSIPASQTDCKGRQGSSGLVTQHTWCATPVAECSFCLWTLIWWPHWQSGKRDPWNMHGHLGSLAVGWSHRFIHL